MSELYKFTFGDGTTVLLQTAPAWEDGEVEDSGLAYSGVSPVGRGKEHGRIERAGKRFKDLFAPVVNVLDEVHETVSQAPRMPDEITVELGLVITAGLNLGLVTGNGQCTMKLTASWRPGENREALQNLTLPR